MSTAADESESKFEQVNSTDGVSRKLSNGKTAIASVKRVLLWAAYSIIVGNAAPLS